MTLRARRALAAAAVVAVVAASQSRTSYAFLDFDPSTDLVNWPPGTDCGCVILNEIGGTDDIPCGLGWYLDCSQTECVNLAAFDSDNGLGDNVCDGILHDVAGTPVDLSCAAFNFEEGDCAPSPPPSASPRPPPR